VVKQKTTFCNTPDVCCCSTKTFVTEVNEVCGYVLHAVIEVILLFELGENEVRLRHFSLRQVKSPEHNGKYGHESRFKQQA
jgi:hypothetical protein